MRKSWYPGSDHLPLSRRAQLKPSDNKSSGVGGTFTSPSTSGFNSIIKTSCLSHSMLLKFVWILGGETNTLAVFTIHKYSLGSGDSAKSNSPFQATWELFLRGRIHTLWLERFSLLPFLLYFLLSHLPLSLDLICILSFPFIFTLICLLQILTLINSNCFWNNR